MQSIAFDRIRTSLLKDRTLSSILDLNNSDSGIAATNSGYLDLTVSQVMDSIAGYLNMDQFPDNIYGAILGGPLEKNTSGYSGQSGWSGDWMPTPTDWYSIFSQTQTIQFWISVDMSPYFAFTLPVDTNTMVDGQTVANAVQAKIRQLYVPQTINPIWWASLQQCQVIYDTDGTAAAMYNRDYGSPYQVDQPNYHRFIIKSGTMGKSSKIDIIPMNYNPFCHITRIAKDTGARFVCGKTANIQLELLATIKAARMLKNPRYLKHESIGRYSYTMMNNINDWTADEKAELNRFKKVF